MTTTTSLGRTPATNPRHAPADSGDWRDDAECRTHPDPNLWFPVGDNANARVQAADAKRICRRCAVLTTCRSWALNTGQDHGVLGGMTEKERLAVHRRQAGMTVGRTRNVAERMFRDRLEEFVALRAQGLEGVELAEALSTNVQTVNRVNDLIAASARAVAQEVAA
ncbi:hypothetical protein DMH12_37350 [Streptomyces sp. WAC 04229]|uniref:WhiB family transcriptional regulator n=1 Tax=Streptomyces sp. WAC 04229 TaxID=2203206 RepID=UPI000F74B7DF|nr:hypothetical protein DMH12_37350 [Streptomyces sp. WAC 04229]